MKTTAKIITLAAAALLCACGTTQKPEALDASLSTGKDGQRTWGFTIRF